MKEMSLSSSPLNIDSSVLSSQEYREKLISLLQPILDRVFHNNPIKRRIQQHKDRISFACPYCMDSMKNDYKKRGNFILQGKFANYYKCHNCGEFKRIDNFFKDFNVELDLNVVDYISQNISDFSVQSNYKYDISIFMNVDEIEKYAIDREEFKRFFGLVEVKNTPVSIWLKNRLQFDESKFLYNISKNYLVILNLTQSGKILGIQKRNFDQRNKYMTYKFSKLYELMRKPKIEDEKLIDELDTLSQIFNILTVNYSKKITLFEGPLDCFLFKNSIANTGIHKSFPIEINLRYWYDDDEIGRKKSIEKINDKYEVFLWSKLKRDYNLPYRKKWDLNDLLIYFKNNNIKVPNFNLYFSDNQFDIIDI